MGEAHPAEAQSAGCRAGQQVSCMLHDVDLRNAKSRVLACHSVSSLRLHRASTVRAMLRAPASGSSTQAVRALKPFCAIVACLIALRRVKGQRMPPPHIQSSGRPSLPAWRPCVWCASTQARSHEPPAPHAGSKSCLSQAVVACRAGAAHSWPMIGCRHGLP